MNLHGSYESANTRSYITERINVHLYIAIKVGNKLILLVTHPTPEVGYTHICLLTVSEITLWDQNVTHGQHSKPSNLLGGVENNRRKPGKETAA